MAEMQLCVVVSSGLAKSSRGLRAAQIHKIEWHTVPCRPSLVLPITSLVASQTLAMASALLAKPCVGLRSAQLSSTRRARVATPVRAMASKAPPAQVKDASGSDCKASHTRHARLQRFTAVTDASSATDSHAPIQQLRS
jgi:hypothetical protein